MSRRHAFTLMEIVLAIALTSVVMYLLITAIELYMIRVDSSRSRVESAQLARTLLDKMAGDLAATRLYATPTRGGPGGGAGSGGSEGGSPSAGGSGDNSAGGGASNGGGMFSGTSSAGGSANSSTGGSGSSSAASMSTPTDVQGLFGTADELRIDRAAYPNWQRSARPVAPEEPATTADMPVSVRYYFVDGDQVTSQRLAAQGVSEEPTAATSTGLYREIIPTAALADDADPLASPAQRDNARVELLAPEIVKMELAYYDGTDLVETWDSFQEAGLPAGVEIRLTIYEPSFESSADDRAARTRLTGQRYKANELVEYRRFVRLPKASPSQPAEALLPLGGGNSDRGGSLGGGQPISGGNNAGQGGQQGGGDGANP